MERLFRDLPTDEVTDEVSRYACSRLQLADSGVEESHQKIKMSRTNEFPWLDDER